MNNLLLENCNFENKNKILNILNKERSYSLKELSKMTQGEFLRNFNLGRKSLKIIRELLLKHNLDFKGDRIFV